ncbi:MAG: YgfZ/GcvT domain-containing protein [Actinomycetales bacterium]
MTDLRPGAIAPPPQVHDQGMAWHFGDPFREQRTLAQGRGIVPLDNRGVVTVTGPDRLGWLHSLTTQHLAQLAPGTSALALILSPHGHVEFELHLVDDGVTTWIITQPGQAEPLRAYLARMVFMLVVEVVDRSADFAVLWEPSDEPDPQRPTWLVPIEFAERGYRGRESIAPSQDAARLLADRDDLAGSWALEALRVAALMPRIDCETDHRTIPNEVGWLTSAVHLDKGCYRGQETVAKVHNLGQPPRRLVQVHLDGSSDHPPGHGDRLWHGDREVGWIGTGAQHYELGPIASAVLKRSTPPTAELVVQSADGSTMAARQEVRSPAGP